MEPQLSSRNYPPLLKGPSVAHEQIMDFIIMNPAATNEDIAFTFNYSPGYVGQLLASDLFKAKLAEKQTAVTNDVLNEVKDKITSLAKKGLDRLLQKIAVDESHRDIRDTTELALRGMGVIAGKGGASVTVNTGGQTAIFQTVDQTVLQAARERMLARTAPGPAEALNAPALIEHGPQEPTVG